MLGIANHQAPLSAGLAGKIHEEVARVARDEETKPVEDDLTEREIEVLQLVARGGINREITRGQSHPYERPLGFGPVLLVLAGRRLSGPSRRA